MIINPYFLKKKAREILKTNLQTALLISFFASLLYTILNLYMSTHLPNPAEYLPFADYLGYTKALQLVSKNTWTTLFTLELLYFMFTPVLTISANYYFICRTKGEELGVMGIFSRSKNILRALALFILIIVKVFLWSLCFIVPGIIAIINYSMAPYFLAEDPTISPWQAIEKSKACMKKRKLFYVVVMLSFIVLQMAALVLQNFTLVFGVIISLVISQAVSLLITTYKQVTETIFFRMLSDTEYQKNMQTEMTSELQDMGVDVNSIEEKIKEIEEEIEEEIDEEVEKEKEEEKEENKTENKDTNNTTGSAKDNE